MKRPTRRRLNRALAAAAAYALVAVVVLSLTQRGSSPRGARLSFAPSVPPAAHRVSAPARSGGASAPPRPAAPKRAATRPSPRTPAPQGVAVHQVVVTFTDPLRTMLVDGRAVRRTVTTVVRYPVGLSGRFPLIVFGHGFAVSPAPYSDLLDAWTRAGYVVAAPIFPLENADAPGGPNERDLVNQPADLSLVISGLQSPTTPALERVAELIDFSRIAVSGQSDGGDTALAAAYGPARDSRIGAAVILSGAEDPFAAPFTMPQDGPPLLALQGTADTINPPEQTYAFWGQAASPKYLLKLLGSGHQPPYTEPGPELTAVERMTLAFLGTYLKHDPGPLRQYVAAASAGPDTELAFK